MRILENENQKDLTPEEQQILKYQEKIKELKEKQKRKKRKEQEQIRKQRTKRLIEVGGLTEKMLGVEGTDETRKELENLLQLKKYLLKRGIKNVNDLHTKIGGYNQ